THLALHPKDLIPLRKYDLAIVGGTNLLKNNILYKSQWKVALKDLLVLRHKVVLLGVGWWQYQEKAVSAYSQLFYKALFTTKYQHAAQDTDTRHKLAEMRVRHVINTGCPAVSQLAEPYCSHISPEKRDPVLTTTTDYMRDADRERPMLELLKQHYREA